LELDKEQRHKSFKAEPFESALKLRGGGVGFAAPKIMSNESDNSPAPGPLAKLRQTIFPIYGEEVKKFLLLGSIKFFIIMALTLTRDTKDTLVVTQCGAEAIAFLKVSMVDT